MLDFIVMQMSRANREKGYLFVSRALFMDSVFIACHEAEGLRDELPKLFDSHLKFFRRKIIVGGKKKGKKKRTLYFVGLSSPRFSSPHFPCPRWPVHVLLSPFSG